MRSHLLHGLIIALIAVSASRCMHAKKDLPYGLQDKHAGYVPARVAVLPCRVWPNGARYEALPLTNVDEKILNDFCEKFDAYVIEGFKDQPYMRGFSPKWVLRFLKDNKQADHLSKIPEIWQHHESNCSDCSTAAAFYVNSIKERKEWRSWLQTMSDSARYADAILAPFLLFAQEITYEEHGLQVSKRAVAATLLLIDTNYGYLLWSGGRLAESTNQQILSPSVKEDPKYPPWEEVKQRLFTPDLWIEYPGRQVYR